jgi:hypothetical protein
MRHGCRRISMNLSSDTYKKGRVRMYRSYSLPYVAIFVGSLLLVGLVLSITQGSHTALAQELPPRPTLTPADEDDGDEEVTTPAATTTQAVTQTPTAIPTLTPTQVPPTPMSLPVTGGSAGGGRMWLVLAIGLLVCGIGLRRAIWFLVTKGRNPTASP